MAATLRAPRQWCLTKTETVTSFENWHQNLVYALFLDSVRPFSLRRGYVVNEDQKQPPSRLH